MVIPGCGILILKDTPATVERKRAAPGLLGTNVLARIPRFAEMMRVPSGEDSKSLESKTTGFILYAACGEHQNIHQVQSKVRSRTGRPHTTSES